VCHALNFNEELGTAYIGHKIVFLCGRVVALHVVANGWNVVLALYIYPQKVILRAVVLHWDILF
jgi:hypothetical protein